MCNINYKSISLIDCLIINLNSSVSDCKEYKIPFLTMKLLLNCKIQQSCKRKTHTLITKMCRDILQCIVIKRISKLQTFKYILKYFINITCSLEIEIVIVRETKKKNIDDKNKETK